MSAIHRAQMKQMGNEVGSWMRSGVLVSDMAWVVEELVLNSLDAGAINVCVYVNVGSCFVKVVDDGCGISRDGLSLLGERYVTSKLQVEPRSTDKVFGSRGEALASISDVSLTEIVTKTSGTPVGYRKRLKGSKCLYLGIDNDRKEVGTTVTVRDLFYNQPVRRKGLLSSPKKVLQSVKSGVFQIALVQPDVNFEVVDGESEEHLLNSRSCPAFLALLNEYGIKDSSFLHQLDFSDGFLRICGQISNPLHEFHSKGFQFIYINSRYVCKGRIHKLLNSLATRNCMYKKWCSDSVSHKGNTRRFIANPSYILNITCPSSLYDLTFEPSKTNVHFADWGPILHFIERAINQIWLIDGREIEIPDSQLSNREHKFSERCFDIPQYSSNWFDVQLRICGEDSNLMNPDVVDFFLPSDSIHTCLSFEENLRTDNPIDHYYLSKGDERSCKRKFFEDCDFANPMSLKKHESSLRTEMPFHVLEFEVHGNNIDTIKNRLMPLGSFDEAFCDGRETMQIFNKGFSHKRHNIPSEDQGNSFKIDGYHNRKMLDAIADKREDFAFEDPDMTSNSARYYERSDNDFSNLFDIPSVATRRSLSGVDSFTKSQISHRNRSWEYDEHVKLQNMPVRKNNRRSHSAPPFLRRKKRFVTLTDVSASMKIANERSRDELLPSNNETEELQYMELFPVNPTSAVVSKSIEDDFDRDVTFKVKEGDLIMKRMDSVTELHNCSKQLKQTKSEPPVLDISSGILHLSSSKLVPTSASKKLLNDVKVLYQVDRKFIPIVSEHVLSLIDQHAADERIRLEELEEKVLKGDGRKITYLNREEQQKLPEFGYRLLLNFEDQIRDWGWVCNEQTAESFKKSLSVLHKEPPPSSTLVAVPNILGVNLNDADLLEFLNQLTETDGSSIIPPSVNRILASKACRGAIMFGDRLLPSECAVIIDELKKTNLWFQCAHGRPTTVPIVSLPTLHEHISALNRTPTLFHGLRRQRISLTRASQRLTAARG